MSLDTICPLCGKTNLERIEADHSEDQVSELNTSTGCTKDEHCWCMTIAVPQELIDQVPEKARNKACICKNCVMQYLAAKADTLANSLNDKKTK